MLPSIIGAIVDAIVEFVSDAANVTMVIDGFVKLFIAVAAGAGRIASAILPQLPTIVGEIINSLATEFAKPENAGPIIAGLGILFGTSTLKTVATNLSHNLKDSIGGTFSKFFSKNIGSDVASEAGNAIKRVGASASSAVTNIGTALSNGFKAIGSILSSAVSAVVDPLKVAFKGVGEAISGFFKAFSDPMIAVGAAMFAVAAAAIAAAVFLIGSAIGAVMPVITTLFNDVLIPLVSFIVGEVIAVLDTLTNMTIALVNSALIPLADFMASTFILVVDSVTDSLTKLTQNAVIPLLETLSGSFTNVLNSVANLITGTLHVALEGIANVVDKVGEGFTHMGNAIKTALDGVNGILGTFRDLILGIADAIVAVVALATGHSIDYGKGFAHITKAATGGRVFGIGTETSDSNLYALSKGEYVIRAAAAQQIGYDNLDYLNKTGGIPSGSVVNITINGYDKDPNELANVISRKIALNTQGVY